MIHRVIRASGVAERVYDHVRCAVRGCVLHLQLRCEYMIRVNIHTYSTDSIQIQLVSNIA